ncbi:MAG: hypothetical protein IIX54_01485 [Clostridia bacterium]|nr:hypothetical protein [Clostridia bacterium]
MKKIIALLMATLMLVSFAACGATTDDASSQMPNDEVSSESTEAATVGQTLLSAFKADNSGTAMEVAERLIGNEIIQFMGGATPIEAGLLSGFDNTEIKGFKDGAMFAPMMSSIAFVGYVFELEDGADVEAFKTTLKDSANLRWNICVEAEELIVENEGNKVFFIMCPKSFEQPEAEDGAGDMGLTEDDMVPAEDGITLE